MNTRYQLTTRRNGWPIGFALILLVLLAVLSSTRLVAAAAGSYASPELKVLDYPVIDKAAVQAVAGSSAAKLAFPESMDHLWRSNPELKVSAYTAATTTVDAGDISAMRWVEMAKFYEKHGMLTRDDFDFEQAADILAMRWQAAAQYYADHDMLTRSPTMHQTTSSIGH